MADLHVGIDFGTANSGCAYNLVANGQDDQRIFNVDLAGQGGALKVPTMVVLENKDPYKFVSFGGGSLNNFDDKKHLLFHKFKMQLYDNPDAKTLKPDIGEVEVDTEVVIARCLAFFKKSALDSIKLTLGRDVTAHEVHWVLTIPAMWTESAKKTMKNAARLAKLVHDDKPNNFTLAFEPECAALSVIHQHIDKLQNQDKYLVFDCGGGTIDIAIHRLTKSEDDAVSVQEIKATQGLDNGSTRIDKILLEELDTFFQHKVKTIKDIGCERFNFLANVLEGSKQSWKVGTKLSLPLTQFAADIIEQCGSLKTAILEYNASVDDAQMKVRNLGQRIVVPSGVIQKIFDKVIGPIAELAKTLLEENPGIKYLFVVGGFASCKYLVEKLEEAISDSGSSATMLQAHNPSMAIVQGAVRYSMNQTIVQKRCAHETIGVETQMDWTLNMPVEWREWDADSQSWKVGHCFSRVVQRGEQVNTDKEIRRTFYPTSETSESVNIRFFSCSSQTIPQLTNDDGVSFLGELSIPVTPGTKPLENPVHIKVKVGDTQVTAIVKSPAMETEEIMDLKSTS